MAAESAHGHAESRGWASWRVFALALAECFAARAAQHASNAWPTHDGSSTAEPAVHPVSPAARLCAVVETAEAQPAATPQAAATRIADCAPHALAERPDHSRDGSPRMLQGNGFNDGLTNASAGGHLGGGEQGGSGRHVSYSFIAYRKFRSAVMWIDEMYTAECVRQQVVARWLVWQTGYRHRVELQVSTAMTEQAVAARHSYMTMGMKAMRRRDRSRVVARRGTG